MLHVSVLRSECYGNLNNRDSIDLASIDHINQFCTNVIIYCQTYFNDYLNNHLNYVTLIFNFPSQYNSYQIHQYSSTTWLKVAPYTSGKIWSARLIFFFLAVCLNISTVINIKILTNSNQQTQSYKFTTHIAAFPSVVFITEMLEICIQISYDQNVQLILKSYLPVVLGTTLRNHISIILWTGLTVIHL